jgi:hypothetical protein
MIRKHAREDLRKRKGRRASMLRRSGAAAFAAACFSLALGLDLGLPAQAQTLTPHQQLAVQIYEELGLRQPTALQRRSLSPRGT